jgi:crossover junction endodeoxyribonuclease RusA
MIELQVRGRPAPQGSKKVFPIKKGKRGGPQEIVGHTTVEMSPHLGNWRDDVKSKAEDFMKEDLGLDPVKDGPLFSGPLRVRMVFTVAKPKASPKRRVWPAKLPDLSKLIRSTEDALTQAGYWEDDRLVVEYSRAAKVYPNEDPDSLPVPGVRIWVEQVTEENCGKSTAA